ncbi:MAG: hypothetical protein M9939_25120 [Mesorhizobium sp.]|nr:hypothetical protein [Mesorhizobium sp.]MCO5164376.1 hypothetical protein [Mesorhizobium sp.]
MAAADPVSRPLLDGRFVWRVFYAFAALALLSAAISVAGRYAGRGIAMAGHTDDTTIAEVVIGNNVIAAPKNMIRFETARRNGVAARLDFYMRWPQLDGYSHAARDDFNHAGGVPGIIFASLSQRMMSRGMSGRYDPIYSKLTEPTETTLPGGLAVRRFDAKSGYMNEILVIAERPGDDPYVARCLDEAASADSLAPCERDVQVGDDLSLTYRFPRELLADWKALDAAVIGKIDSMLKTGR